MNRMAREDHELELAWPLAALAVVVLVAWLIPAGVTLLHDGSLPPLVAGVGGTVRLVGHHLFAHPWKAYGDEIASHMPEDSTWWWSVAMIGALVASVALIVWRAVDRRRSRETLGRRRHELRGARPRAWARRRDLRDVAVRSRRPDRFSLGSIDGQRLASDDEAHVAVIAPTRSGKTTRCVIPWLLEHPGPAIVTSTKTDVLSATRGWRERIGRVTVWDPFGAESASWAALAGCEDWSGALRQAQWFADAVQDGDSELAAYWRGEAARLLGPLLHAAALCGRGITDVTAWVDGQVAKEPLQVLSAAGADAAARQLQGVLALDDRNRGTMFMSAGSLLAAYRYPEVTRDSGMQLTAEAFLDGGPNTLYIVASSRQQRLLAPLVVAMLSSILHLVAERANTTGSLLSTLRVLLDEAANIAPLRDLPVHLSQASAHGVRIATMWQSLSQIEHRYRRASGEILANSTAKLYLGPVTDSATLRHLRDVLGDEETTNGGRRADASNKRQPKASPAALQQLAPDRALLVEGRHIPAIVCLKPWWEQRIIRRRARTRRQ